MDTCEEHYHRSCSLQSPLIQIEDDDAVRPLDSTEKHDGQGVCFSVGRECIVKEIKKQLWLAAPLISVRFLLYCLQIISVMFVGHLGELTLSGASMASSFGNVSGFNVMLGLSSALDTFCGQSYGAKQYRMLGVHVQQAMVVLLLVSMPIAVIWAYMRPILIVLGQNPEVAKEAGTYARFMIPSLFAYGLLQCLVKFLQTQSIVFPMMISSGIIALLHILICWALVFKSGLGFRGAAVANSISYWLNVLFLVIYVKSSPSCSKTWPGFTKESLHNVLAFIKLAIPSAVMVCLELWSFEIIVLLSGLLPDPTLETSVLSICFNTAATVWMIPLGLSGAVSTRVSNELGAGNPRAASLAAYVVIGMAVAEGILVGTVLVLIKNVWGYAYSNVEEVVKHIAIMMPIIACSNFLDGLQCVLSGAARGCGWQKLGAYVNLAAYYVVGIPCAVLLGFVLQLGAKGLWLGMICALIIQTLALLFITLRTNWEEEAKKATERVCNSLVQAPAE